MPITLNGSGTVTGISAGGLPDGVITTDDIAANAVTFAKIGTTEQGQLCKAWVNFNGTSTVAIRASYNVSSITDNGVGDYTVNFTTAMVDANYAVTGHGTRTATGPGLGALFPFLVAGAAATRQAPTTNAFRIASQNFGGTAFDDDYVLVAVFR